MADNHLPGTRHTLGDCRCFVLETSATGVTADGKLEDPSSKKANPVQEAQVCDSSPMLPGGYQAGYAGAEYSYCCVLLVLLCLLQSQILR